MARTQNTKYTHTLTEMVGVLRACRQLRHVPDEMLLQTVSEQGWSAKCPKYIECDSLESYGRSGCFDYGDSNFEELYDPDETSRRVTSHCGFSCVACDSVTEFCRKKYEWPVTYRGIYAPAPDIFGIPMLMGCPSLCEKCGKSYFNFRRKFSDVEIDDLELMWLAKKLHLEIKSRSNEKVT